MFGRMMDERLAKLHFWPSLIFITLVFGGQLIAGYSGQQRRLYDPFQYTFLEHLRSLNLKTSWAAFLLAASQTFFVVNFFRSMFAGKRAEDNPWKVPTLEWTISSPPPHYNFKEIPTVYRGPFEFANPEVEKAIGRDWLGQTEPLPDGVREPSAAMSAVS